MQLRAKVQPALSPEPERRRSASRLGGRVAWAPQQQGCVGCIATAGATGQQWPERVAVVLRPQNLRRVGAQHQTREYVRETGLRRLGQRARQLAAGEVQHAACGASVIYRFLNSTRFDTEFSFVFPDGLCWKRWRTRRTRAGSSRSPCLISTICTEMNANHPNWPITTKNGVTSMHIDREIYKYWCWNRVGVFDQQCGHLKFESRFESGNLRKAIKV